MLSDAGSAKYEDDEMSHYMGQSALGGVETGSNVGGFARDRQTTGGGENLSRSVTSRR